MTKYFYIILSCLLSVSSSGQTQYYEFMINNISAFNVRNDISEIIISKDESPDNESPVQVYYLWKYLYDKNGKPTEISHFYGNKFNTDFEDSSTKFKTFRYILTHKDEILPTNRDRNAQIDSFNYNKIFKYQDITIVHYYSLDAQSKLLKEYYRLDFMQSFRSNLDWTFKFDNNYNPEIIYYYTGFSEGYKNRFDTSAFIEYKYYKNKITKSLYHLTYDESLLSMESNTFLLDKEVKDKYNYDTSLIPNDLLDDLSRNSQTINYYNFVHKHISVGIPISLNIIVPTEELLNLTFSFSEPEDFIYFNNKIRFYFKQNDSTEYLEKLDNGIYSSNVFFYTKVHFINDLKYISSFYFTPELDTSKQMLRKMVVKNKAGNILVEEEFDEKLKEWNRTNYFYEGDNLYGHEKFRKKRNGTAFKYEMDKKKYKLISSFFLTDEYINNYFKVLEQQGYKIEFIKN